jgi:hypothetical protein
MNTYVHSQPEALVDTAQSFGKVIPLPIEQHSP